MTQSPLPEPELTFPAEVADFVRAAYAEAKVVLEYGSGGSTVLAARAAGTRCFSVESDARWADNLRLFLDAECPGHRAVVHHADIGPTTDWGRPAKVSIFSAPAYARYPRSVWQRPDFVHPDLVLIDGRFRVGCFLAVLARIERPTTILFDDYAERSHYHVVEQFGPPAHTVGRMAVFEAEPGRIGLADKLRLLRAGLSPR